MKITSVLVVESVEASLDFWVGRMGFGKGMEMPHEGRIGFAILERDGAELMLQNFASARADTGEFGPKPGSSSALYIEVGDFEDTKKRLAGYSVALAERKTFYGMREIGVTEPGGHWVIFAAKA